MESNQKITSKDLLRRAQDAKIKSIADFSKFHVGAALLTADGKIFTGCNIENFSLSLSICAERVALFKALSEGERDFIKIAVVSDDSNHCPPCGTCRQVLFEFAPQISVVMINKDNIIKEISIKELLPYPFDVKHAGKI